MGFVRGELIEPELSILLGPEKLCNEGCPAGLTASLRVPTLPYMAAYPEQDTYPADELAEGVGESGEHIGPAPIARMERGIGGVLVVVSAVGIFLSTIFLMFGLAPIGIVILLFVPLFWLGVWLRRRGSDQLTALDQD